MTPFQRVQIALDRGIPDRVPVFELCVDPRMVAHLGLRSYIEFFEEMDVDAAIPDALLDYPEGAELTLPHGNQYINEWGVKQAYTGEMVPMPVDHPLRDASDLANYRPPSDRFSEAYIKRVEAVVKRYRGHRAILGHQSLT